MTTPSQTLRYYIYGEVGFTSEAKRNSAGRRLDQRASKAGFTPATLEVLVQAYPDWPSGRGNVLVDGMPGLRFCYSTDSEAIANEAYLDVAAAWDVFSDTNSWWGTIAQPV